MNQQNFNGVWVAIGLSVIAILMSLGTLVWQPAPVEPSAGVEALGVTNLDSLHLSDSGGTATPVLRVNQTGSGKVAEFLDGGTVVASINNGGSWDGDGAVTLNSTLDVDGNISSGTGALTFTTNVLANSFVIYGEQTVVEATSAGTITATGTYQPITSTAVVTLGTTAIADGSTEGQYLCLVNENASDTIAISDGQNTNLSGNVVLGNDDTLCMIWDGADWVEVGQVDN